jgi:hypothetical protein
MISEAPQVLREYALVADGERGALIGPRGEFAWLCAPRWDSPAVFSSLIGGGGTYLVTPTERYVWGGQYEPGSLIWRSRWVTETGIIECREALAFPGDPYRAVVLRQVIAVRGEANVRVVLEPAAEFGAEPTRGLHRNEQGSWVGRSGPLWWRCAGVPSAARCDAGRAVETTLRLPVGRSHDLVLELSRQPLPDAPVDPAAAWEATEHAWAQAVPELAASIAPRDARHAYAVLRGLTSTGGGMVAAATMGLPERARYGRNYDYRYVWIRDQCYAGHAVAAAGPHPLLDDAVRFVTARLLEHGPDLSPAYTTRGTPVPDERTLDLPGYPGGADVIGNHVNTQFQLDAFGEALQLYAAAARHDRLDTDARTGINTAIAAIEQRWQQPDAGLWELDTRRWAHSRLACAAGLRATAAHTTSAQAASCSALADAIVADTADCAHPSGRWQRAPDDPRIDAALLLPTLRGAIPAVDPRSVATLRAVTEELTEDGYVYRFRHDNRSLGSAEGAFTLCGFLLAQAAHQHGDPVAAARWFERSRAACGPPGLYAEEYDVTQRQLRGNLPQAFVHALMLETSLRLAEPPVAR